MLKSFVISALLFLTVLTAYGQVDSLNYGPEPKGGIGQLVLPFYKIKFSPAQRALLKRKEIELLFSVNERGGAALEDIKGVTDSGILDSLQRTAHQVPGFHPRTLNGVKESSLYFLRFQLPDYPAGETNSREQNLFIYREPAFEDYEYIHKSGERLDILFGAVGNAFIGNTGKYLHPGGGMKMELLYTGKKGFGGGMVMNFYGNKLKQDYPISSTREQNSGPPTLLVGIALNKTFQEKQKSALIAQLELNYAVQNITPKLDYDDEEWVQLNGFSPGFVINYLMKIGKDKTAYYYGRPSIFNHNLNVHGAVRPVIFNLRAATGIMLEIGVSYRFSTHFVDEYHLRQ